ncbi:hypothetical protein PSPO01_11081 [Paraphaeosphaeria sporulosa]
MSIRQVLLAAAFLGLSLAAPVPEARRDVELQLSPECDQVLGCVPDCTTEHGSVDAHSKNGTSASVMSICNTGLIGENPRAVRKADMTRICRTALLEHSSRRTIAPHAQFLFVKPNGQILVFTMFWDTPAIPALYGSIIPFLVLDFIVIILRFVMRRRLGQKFQADDWLMLPAFAGVIGLVTMYFYGLGTKSLGYRYMLLPPAGTDISSPDFVPEFAGPTSRIVRTRRLEYSSLILFSATAGLIKISVLLLYRRIFTIIPSYKDARNIFFIVMITLISAWSISWIFAFVFMCRKDVQTLFTNPENLTAKCVDTFAVGYSHSISDFITDALILLIPIPFVWKLHLPVTRKLAVVGIFLMGVLAAGSSLVRMIWMAWNTSVGFGDETDEEPCLPTLRGMFKAQSMDSFVHGIRTMFSLPSASRSRSWKGSKGDSPDASFESQRVTAAKLSYSRHSNSSVDA